MILEMLIVPIDIGRGGDGAVVPCGGGDGAGVHERNGRDLTLAGLGALAVGEVPGGVAERETVVGGNVACAEARTAEALLDDSAAPQKLFGHADPRELKAGGNGGGIYAEAEVAVAHVVAVHYLGGGDAVVEGAAGAACDDALIGVDLAVDDLVGELEMDLRTELLLRLGFDLLQYLNGIREELVDRVGVGGMEGERDHALDLAEVKRDHAVVISDVLRIELPESLGTAVDAVILFDLGVGLPDGGEAGGLGGHNVDAVPEVIGQILDARADELHDLVLYEAVCKGRLYEGERNVVRADALLGLAGDVNKDYLGRVDVPGVLKELLNELGSAFADAHRAESAVTGMGVGTQYHVAAVSHRLAGIAVDNALVDGNVDAAVLLCGGKAEYVVILIDGAADSAKAVVAVGHRIGDGEFLQAGRPCRLNDADIGDVMRHKAVKPYLHLFGIIGGVVCAKDLIRDRILTSLGRGHAFDRLELRLAVYQVNAVLKKVYHGALLLFFCSGTISVPYIHIILLFFRLFNMEKPIIYIEIRGGASVRQGWVSKARNTKRSAPRGRPSVWGSPP